MRRLIAIVMMLCLFGVVGCAKAAQPEFHPVEQQNVMTRMTLAAGYEIAGIPQYEGTRWTANVSLPGCAVHIKLGGNEVAESVGPTSFVVLSIGGIPFADTNPKIDSYNMSAATLKSLAGMTTRLGCATAT